MILGSNPAICKLGDDIQALHQSDCRISYYVSTKNVHNLGIRCTVCNLHTFGNYFGHVAIRKRGVSKYELACKFTFW